MSACWFLIIMAHYRDDWYVLITGMVQNIDEQSRNADGRYSLGIVVPIVDYFNEPRKTLFLIMW